MSGTTRCRQPSPSHHHPLVGLRFHSFHPDTGLLEWQGEILAVDGDIVLLQLYDWIAGAPSDIARVSRQAVYSDRFQLYPATQDMDEAYKARQREGRTYDSRR